MSCACAAVTAVSEFVFRSSVCVFSSNAVLGASSPAADASAAAVVVFVVLCIVALM